jgi:pyruvate/2-oxoglutarate dehydrogenase complex dihydrolipoamide dehydrogenase (E3) component
MTNQETTAPDHCLVSDSAYGGGMATGELASEYDVIVIGLGPGGGEVAERLSEAGLQVLGVDPHLVGGECPYYGCIPSKMIVRAAGTLAETSKVNTLAGSATATPDYSVPATRIRTEATDDWNDQVAVDRLERLGGHFVRAAGRLAGRDQAGRARVEVDGKTITATRAVVVATGTAPAIPPIPGLAELTADGLSPDGRVWTNREILQIKQAPESLVVVGGGAVGCELSQGLARFGVHITQLEGGERLLGPEEPEASHVVAEVLRREGIDVQTGVQIASVQSAENGVAVELEDGRRFEAERLLVAAGRRQHLPELGLDSVGLDQQARTLAVDEHMQVAGGIYAVGDVTGRGAFTHVAVWQARVLIAHLLGRPEPYGGYDGLAWVTFTDPEVGRVGMSEKQARDSGIDVAIGHTEIASSTRGWIHGPGNDGFVKLVADRARAVLVGATVVAPYGGEILGLLTLAVHAQVPLVTLASMHYAYPTLHRAILEAVRQVA